MTKYRGYTFFLVLTFLYATHAAVTKGKETNIAITDDQKNQIEQLLKVKLGVELNEKGLSAVINNDKENQDKEVISLIQADKQINNHIDLENETLTMKKEKKDAPTPKYDKELLNGRQDIQNKLSQGDIKLIHEEMHEAIKELELPYYTKPTTQNKSEKKTNEIIQNNGENGENMHIKLLNDENKHLIEDNVDKEKHIKQLKEEKKLILKKIINSIDTAVNNTRNISEKRDLKEIKAIIKITEHITNSKESIKVNVSSTATSSPAGLLTKMLPARRAHRLLPNVFSGEVMRDLGALRQGVHADYFQYTTTTARDFVKEDKRREKHRGLVKANLEAWLDNRVALGKDVLKENKTWQEKCENWGYTTDRAGKTFVRPCCKFCCRGSIMGCY